MWDGLDRYDLTGVSQRSELMDRATEFCEAIGSKSFSYIMLNAPVGHLVKDEYVVTNSSSAWLTRYVERNYKFHDPLAKLCARSRLPFYWGQPGFADHLEKAERLVLHEAREFNHVEGYVVPTAGPEGDIGGLCFCMDAPNSAVDVVAESAAQIQLFAAQFHAAAVHVFFDGRLPPAVRLTPRELEVLSWAADGLSSEATAERMRLTAPTVNYHLTKSCRKLGASNKMQAVALALRQGLI